MDPDSGYIYCHIALALPSDEVLVHHLVLWVHESFGVPKHKVSFYHPKHRYWLRPILSLRELNIKPTDTLLMVLDNNEPAPWYTPEESSKDVGTVQIKREPILEATESKMYQGHIYCQIPMDVPSDEILVQQVRLWVHNCFDIPLCQISLFHPARFHALPPDFSLRRLGIKTTDTLLMILTNKGPAPFRTPTIVNVETYVGGHISTLEVTEDHTIRTLMYDLWDSRGARGLMVGKYDCFSYNGKKLLDASQPALPLITNGSTLVYTFLTESEVEEYYA